MAFTSYGYLWFLALVVALRWSVPRRAAPAVLLAASVFFLWTFGWLGTGLLLGAGCITWAGGLWLAGRPAERRRGVLAALIVLLVGDLALFKYAAFVVGQIDAVAGWLGRPGLLPSPGLVAPVAISFFTFQMIAYLVDVHRGRHPVERDLLRLLAHLTFFPNVVSGPIVRPGDLLPQLRAPRAFDSGAFSVGVFVFLGGALKKLVLADALAPAVARVFDAGGPLPASAAWIGSLAFTAQIFCDFSGYTDMARGAAAMLGFDLPPNFRLPYLSTSIADFWRRWHISLSFWLRDYLYIPLGGSRRGRWRTHVNLLATMALAGLWHGASWTMVVWGLFHGALLSVHRAFRDLVDGRPRWDRLRASPLWTVPAALLTFGAVHVGWVLFRAASLPAAWRVLRAMFFGARGPATLPSFRGALLLLSAVAIGHAVAANDAPRHAYGALSPATRGLLWAALVLACFWFAAAPGTFLYVRF